MKTVAVLGGGIGGLATAYYLSKSPQVAKVTNSCPSKTFIQFDLHFYSSITTNINYLPVAAH